jgi:hypothetical protein
VSDEEDPEEPTDLAGKRAEKEAAEAFQGIATGDDLIDAFEVTPILERVSKERVCWNGHHERYRLDRDSKRVFCGKCGEEVDPFSALDDFARRWDRYTGELAHIRKEIASSRSENDDARRLERNTKARLRKAKERLESTDPMAFRIANTIDEIDRWLSSPRMEQRERGIYLNVRDKLARLIEEE